MATRFGPVAVFDGIHAGWSPTKQVFSPFATLPISVGSFYSPRLAHHDVFVSNELPIVKDLGDRFEWQLWGRRGTARFFMGTPKVDSPRALHVPYFYWPWPMLQMAPRTNARRERGLSFVASNSANGTLARDRLALALALAPRFPVHLSTGLRASVPSNAPVSFHDVPRDVFAKHAFMQQFTFNLASENERADGYLTEKPFEALMAGAVPLYEGDPGAGAWMDGLVDASGGVDAVWARIEEAERAGLPERVQREREALVRVSFEAMMGRIWELAGRVRAEGERETDWRDRSRVSRLRHAVSTPRERAVMDAKALVRGVLSRLRR